MKQYKIECVNEGGQTAATLIVSCKTLADAQRMAPLAAGHAVLIRPHAPPRRDSRAAEAAPGG